MAQLPEVNVMKRIIVLAAVLALAGAGIAAAAGGTKVTLRKTSLGKLAANSHGFTLYAFTRDSRNTDRCVKIKNCTSTWTPLTTKAKPVAGTGISKSLLGTIKLPSGKTQVTYSGHPLYTYSGDFGPGQTDYVGISQFGGKWYGVNAKGNVVK
jgi:predicted lipoprotein with Yx(FWY)xxD motif